MPGVPVRTASAGVIVRLLARLFLERSNVLVRLADVRARAEILDVRGECRDCAGAHGLGPGVIVRHACALVPRAQQRAGAPR